MDELAITTLLGYFDESRSTLDSWLEFWTLLVVVGVVMEVVFVVWEYRQALHEFNRGIVRPPDRPNAWFFVAELLGVALVAIGVAGEMYGGAQLSDLETKIRAANDLRAALLSKSAGDAKQAAQQARIAASVAKSQASAVKKLADKASASASNALTLVTRAEDKVSSVESRVAAIDSRTRNRRLSKEQEEAFMLPLKSLSNQKIVVSVSGGTDEAQQFARQLRSLFTQSGWQSGDWPVHLDFSNSGILVMIPKSLMMPDGKTFKVTPALRSVMAAFAAVEINLVKFPSTRGDDMIEVVVGANPNE